MTRPWETIESVATDDGQLELRKRGDDEFLITVAGRVLMNSRANRSELALSQLACQALPPKANKSEAPRVLIGGLGMGCTLRAALDELPPEAKVSICELNPIVEGWCRGPLAPINGNALEDRRSEVLIRDVAEYIRAGADSTGKPRLDVIILDLYEGPHAKSHAVQDPFYGSRALEATYSYLAPGGIFAVWGENQDKAFVKRLRAAGFEVEFHRPGRGGLRHAVFIAQKVRSKKD
jgi:spermidine synthase